MAGVYIHIPFCKKACHYCNFHFSTSKYYIDKFLSCLNKEIELQKDYLQGSVATIYFGGGTPSILSTPALHNILEHLNKTFTIDADAEITLEANPDDITAAKLQEWKEIGINRLSIGIQSFGDEDLKWMNRAHNAQQAETCITTALDNGFNNLSIDLIYGTPTLSDAQWKTNVDKAIAYGVHHLSCYALTVEPQTALDRMIQLQKASPVDNEKQAQHFELLTTWMNIAGYEHYEISNFAKPGCRSKHNSSYWQGEYYLGLGPSAHSFNGISRQWNVANNALYIKSLEQNIVPYEKEILTETEKINEYIMTSLRTMEGIATDKIENEFGKEILDKIINGIQPYLRNDQLIIINNRIIATQQGKLFVDGIAASLFI